jgi:uncharacterized small protein (DUF1192 family)
MTDDLVKRLRDSCVYNEQHYAPDPLVAEAANRIEALTAENERLRAALVAEREENLWSAYATGDVRGDEWTHMFMSDGEWLAKECGFDPRQGYYSAEAIRNAIPIAARAALGDTQ